MRIYGKGRRVLRGMMNFYDEGSACVRVGSKEREKRERGEEKKKRRERERRERERREKKKREKREKKKEKKTKKESKRKMREKKKEREKCEVRIGLGQECVMSPSLFNIYIYIYMDGVVR